MHALCFALHQLGGRRARLKAGGVRGRGDRPAGWGSRLQRRNGRGRDRMLSRGCLHGRGRRVVFAGGDSDVGAVVVLFLRPAAQAVAASGFVPGVAVT